MFVKFSYYSIDVSKLTIINSAYTSDLSVMDQLEKRDSVIFKCALNCKLYYSWQFVSQNGIIMNTPMNDMKFN